MYTNIENIVLPESLMEIGESAFCGTNLQSVEIPGTVIKIGENAFACHGLVKVTVPGTVKELDDLWLGTIYHTPNGTIPNLEIVCENDSPAFKFAVKNNIKYRFS